MASSENMISETDKKSAQKAYAVAGAMTRLIAARRFVISARPSAASTTLASASPGLFLLALEPWTLGIRPAAERRGRIAVHFY
jgi:hypothetical protein